MLSIIICTYNRDKYIYNVLRSLAENTLPHDSYEIVLVDNNCTDNTRAECDRFSQDFPDVVFRYFVETAQGLSHARNRGIKESAGEIRDILPIMCSTDYTVAKLMGVNLHRDKTLATGDPCCDYLYTRPGSEIEKKWQAEHPEGTFHSK